MNKTRRARKLKHLDTFIESLFTLSLIYTIFSVPAYSQQIVPDGNTHTNLSINKNTTNVITETIKNHNAFNSFSKFNVDNGKIVNLVVPKNSQNLINLIHSETSNINGILNSLKNNHIGGNVFLVNPYGVTIGAKGIINVGSLTTITPTKDFMNNFFTSAGNPDDTSVNTLINGELPINSNASLINNGQINTIESFKSNTGSFFNTGDINTSAVFKETDIDVGDVVNINPLENASAVAVNNGNVIIRATNDIVNSGKIVADGSNNIDAGNIGLIAGNNITLASNSLISAKGKGENSNAGNIYALADNNLYFNKGAILDVRGGNVSGDGGFIELSSNNLVEIDGGIFKANANNGQPGQILIDPPFINVGDTYSDGADINFTADIYITVLTDATVSSRNLLTPAIGEDVSALNHMTALSQGNSGSITFDAPTLTFGVNSRILSFADNGFVSGNIDSYGKNIEVCGATFNSGTDRDVQFISSLAGSDIFILRNTSIDARNFIINSAGKIRFHDANVTGNTFLTSSQPATDTDAEIGIGNYATLVNINGNLTATATAGNIYYYGGSVSGNATFNTGEDFDHRYSLSLGHYNPVNIGGNLNISSIGHVVFEEGLVAGNTTINSLRSVGIFDVNLLGNLNANTEVLGLFGNNIGGNVNITSYYGALLGVDRILNVAGDVVVNSFGPVAYYLGDVGGNLNIVANNLVAIGSADPLRSLAFTYHGQIYDINDLPVVVPVDNNDIAVAGNVNIAATDSIFFYPYTVGGEVRLLSNTGNVILTTDNLLTPATIAGDLILSGGVINFNGSVESIAGDIILQSMLGLINIPSTGYLSTGSSKNIYMTKMGTKGPLTVSSSGVLKSGTGINPIYIGNFLGTNSTLGEVRLVGSTFGSLANTYVLPESIPVDTATNPNLLASALIIGLEILPSDVRDEFVALSEDIISNVTNNVINVDEAWEDLSPLNDSLTVDNSGEDGEVIDSDDNNQGDDTNGNADDNNQGDDNNSNNDGNNNGRSDLNNSTNNRSTLPLVDVDLRDITKVCRGTTCNKYLENSLGQYVIEVLFQGLSNDNEFIADYLAVKYSSDSNYHPKGLEGFLKTIKNLETFSRNTDNTNIITSSIFNYKHPPTDERIEKVENLINTDNVKRTNRIINQSRYERYIKELEN